jgi:hypothetical protein
MAHLRDKYQAAMFTVTRPWITLKLVNILTTDRFAEIDLLRKVTGFDFQDRIHLTFYGSVIPTCINTLKTQNLIISPKECICVSLDTNNKDRLFS